MPAAEVAGPGLWSRLATAVAPAVAQRKCAACEEEEEHRGPALQPKLRVSQPGDRWEREADAIAERVVSAAPPPALEARAPTRGAAQVQRAAIASGASGASGAPDGSAPPGVASAGAPLAPAVRGFFEPRFGADFSGVRVHAGSDAARAARDLNARAYTVGRHVVFGAGEYRPETAGGQLLLAHELTHVLQQEAARPGRDAATPAEPTAQRAVMDSMASDYDVEYAIRAVRFALRMALTATSAGGVSAERKRKLDEQIAKLAPVLPKLEAARDKDGQGATAGFDTDPKKNEVIAGDADKTITELFGNFGKPPKPRPPQAPPELNSWALPGGLRVTPFAAASGTEAQACAIFCVAIIVVAALLISGCKSEQPNTDRSADCNEDETKEIDSYHKDAGNWVSIAVNRLAAYRNGSAGSEVKGWVEAALDANFKTRDKDAVTKVAGRLDTIKSMFDAGATGRYTCVCSGSAEAYTYGRGDKIHLCSGWWKSTDAIRRKTTVIHEMAHTSGVDALVPIVAGKPSPDTYEFYERWKTMDSALAVQNPDSYAVFCRMLANDGKEPPGSHK